jgi:catechol 2,3-dioxygenase-like lactoylglutathione lyase family enzyme
MVPVFRVRSLGDALAFYRDTLGFTVHKAEPTDAPFYAVLSRDGEEFHLQQDGAATEFRQSAILRVNDADVAFAALLARGYRPPDRPESPVHTGPVDQSWGSREFYVDDPSGNTLCFAALH